MDEGPVHDPLAVARAGPLDATVTLPGSKSLTNRALVCAALARGRSHLPGALEADDTVAMATCLRSLGVPVGVTGSGGFVVGAAVPHDAPVRLDARQSGTTARFLLPLLALRRGRALLDGDPQLLARPMGPSFDAVRALGAVVEEQDRPGHLPAIVRGPIHSGSVGLPGDVSSQFLSGLLLVGPALDNGLRIRCETPLVSRPYVEMTLAVMRAFGAHVAEDGDGQGWFVGGPYRSAVHPIEPDASAASYAWAAAVVTGGRVTVPGLTRDALQGDVAFAEVLGRMGATVTWHEDATTVEAGDRLVGIDVDMSEISDTVPTLAAVAALAEGPTTIRGVDFIRFKETDRIAAPVAELVRLGIDAEATDDGMVIRPRPRGAARRVDPAVVRTYRDHRMAMAFALLGLVADGIEIADPGCVDKTFPGYWDLLDRLRAGEEPPARAV